MSTSQTKWANRTKAATKAVPVGSGNGGGKNDRGTRYEGTIASAEATVFRTGSFGIKFKYSITSGGDDAKPRALFENVVLTKMNEDGTPSPTKYGEATLKKRLIAAGMSSKDVNSFSIPKNVNAAEGAFEGMVGAPVAVYAVATEYLGKRGYNVRAVFPLGDQEEAA